MIADRRIGFRVNGEDLAVIDHLADEYGMTRTQYVVDAACDRLPVSVAAAEQRLDGLEQRVALLERRMGLEME